MNENESRDESPRHHRRRRRRGSRPSHPHQQQRAHTPNQSEKPGQDDKPTTGVHKDTAQGRNKNRGRRRGRRKNQARNRTQNQAELAANTTTTDEPQSQQRSPKQKEKNPHSGAGAKKPQRSSSRKRSRATAAPSAAKDSSNNPSRNSRRGTESRPSGRRKSSHTQRRTNRPSAHQARRSPARASAHDDPQHSELPISVETSAGGLVISGLAESVSPDGHVDLSKIYVALIGRLDRRGRLLWSMPKGHVEPDESHYSTAEREVWEETGVAGEVIADLGTIDYWFISEGVRIHKTVHHHMLRYVDGNLNDEDPEVTEVAWLPVNQLVERLAYADERRLAHQAFEKLPDYARAEASAGRLTPR